jgi:hypothetical protein
MTDSTMIKMRQSARDELQTLTERYLAAGHSINRLSHIERAEYRTISNGRGFNSRPMPRRDTEAAERQIAEHGRALAAIGLSVEQAMRQMRKTNNNVARLRITCGRMEQLAAVAGYAFAPS